MDWPNIIKKLQRSGHTLQSIASSAGVAQGTISSLKSGATASPRYDLGVALLALHRDVAKAAARKKAAAAAKKRAAGAARRKQPSR